MKTNQVQAEQNDEAKFRRVDICGRFGLYKNGLGDARIYRSGEVHKEGKEYGIGRLWIDIKLKYGNDYV